MTHVLSEPRLSVRRLACARCGAAFECGSGGEAGVCWCMDEPVRLPMPDNANQDCLCPECLRRTARNQATGPTV